MTRWVPQQPQGNSAGGSGYSVRRCSQNCGNSIRGRRGFRRVRGGGESALAVLGVLLLRIQPLDDFGHEEQLLIGRRGVPLATLAEHRPLEEPQLLGGLRQLLLIAAMTSCCCAMTAAWCAMTPAVADAVLLGLLQLTNPLLAGRQLIGKRWTSVLHALLNARHRDLVLLTRDFFRGRATCESCANGFMHAAIAGDAARWPSRCLPRSASNHSVASRSRRAKHEPSSRTARAAFGTSKVPPSNRLYQITSPSPANQSTFTRSLRRLKKRNRSPDSTCWRSSRSTIPTRPSKTPSHVGGAGLGKDTKRRGQASASACPSCRRGRESSDHRTDRLHITALDPKHDATRPLNFQPSHVSRWVTDDLHGNEGLLRCLAPGFTPGPPQSPLPSMK